MAQWRLKIISTKNSAAGCLYGTAIGDALAAKTEFVHSAEMIESRFGPREKFELKGNPACVTDDTQMALAVGEALMETSQPFTAAVMEKPLREAFIAWMDSPDNNRAPGMTCMSACENLQRGLPWTKATIINSKGCGANMRVQPVGLLKVDAKTRAAIAQFQAALTHGHPTGLAASDLTAFSIAELAAGRKPNELPEMLMDYANSQREVYHEVWLGRLYVEAHETPEKFISRGWDECIGILNRLKLAVEKNDRECDPCISTGEGWIAEEAFGTSLLCFLLYPDDPLAAVRRAAYTAGDSDSLACLAGAYAGAYHGVSAWPEDWIARIEYKDRLDKLVDWFSCE